MKIFLFIVLSFASIALHALDVPYKAGQKIRIKSIDAQVSISPTVSTNVLKLEMTPSSDDWVIESYDNALEVIAKDYENIEKKVANKAIKKLDVLVPAEAMLEIFAVDGLLNIQKVSKDTFINWQKGKILIKNCTGQFRIQVQKGEISINSHQGKLALDTMSANTQIKDFTGDLDLQSFSGDVLLDQVRGFISINNGSAAVKIVNSSGTIQFEQSRGQLSVQNSQGRIDGQTTEGTVNIGMTLENEISVKSQIGKVVVQAPPGSGAYLNLATNEGDLYLPSYLKIVRDSVSKSVRGRLRGDNQKGSVYFRGQEASIIIK